MPAYEVNFDGIVGPTHHYAGLPEGNFASSQNAFTVANPQLAALQGLQKMRQLLHWGCMQGVLPPQERPHLSFLRSVGFQGTDLQVLETAYREAPRLFAAGCSASSMWTANAATVSPSADTVDQRVHFTPANLASHLHRSLEAETTAHALKIIFPHPDYFVHHPPLPFPLRDEGAANHLRLAPEHATPGTEIFVYGGSVFGRASQPTRYPARQSLEAAQAIARLHGLAPQQTLWVQQNPEVIDQGVFHNDVIAVSNANVLLFHEQAFLETAALLAGAASQFAATAFYPLMVKTEELSVETAVATYLFNSQLLTLPNGKMALLAPAECAQNLDAYRIIQGILAAANPIEKVLFLNVRESMKNGGGPACLRLRVVLTETELAQVHAPSLMNMTRLEHLEQWVRRHYRDRLILEDFLDPQFLQETQTALDELTQILQLGNFYAFQR